VKKKESEKQVIFGVLMTGSPTYFCCSAFNRLASSLLGHALRGCGFWRRADVHWL